VEAIFICLTYSLGFVFINLPTFLMKLNKSEKINSDNYCDYPQSTRNTTGDQSFYSMLLISTFFILSFNCLYFRHSSVTILKAYNWFINAIITAAVVVYHFPVALLNLVFMFPLLHNCVPLFYLNAKSKKLE